ncbi:MAG: MBL fold metallo-hydrolase [Porticoccaceae bacterium]|nr:MAG: MBL fold metallo-hydrolase [Porticoccaceae bacterium]
MAASAPPVPGRLDRLSPRVRRLTAPNPGLMTGPGTNTYLLGEEEVAVIDPGPADPSHVAAILEACAGRLRWVVVTHTHPDHSPGAATLAAATGATLVGCVLRPDDGRQDRTFRPDWEPRDGVLLRTAEYTLEAIHTPGHVANHYCFLLREEGLLFAGDHLMEGGTVAILPPSGDLAAYLASLERLAGRPPAAVAPGHGALIADSARHLREVIAHRRWREARVVEALAAGTDELDGLLERVYADVGRERLDLARQVLVAHLLKLEGEGRARREPAAASPEAARWHLA